MTRARSSCGGPNVFKGYWNRDEDTTRSSVDGWFRTGDIAVQDEEGYLYLVDRKRDLIIVSGFNVFPSEVESCVAARTRRSPRPPSSASPIRTPARR